MVALSGPDFGSGQRPRKAGGERIYPFPSPVEPISAHFTGSSTAPDKVGAATLSTFWNGDKIIPLEALADAVRQRLAEGAPELVDPIVNSVVESPGGLSSVSGSQRNLFPNGAGIAESANGQPGSDLAPYGVPVSNQ